MSCYTPINAWRSLSGKNEKTGLTPLVFKAEHGDKKQAVLIPCGKCIGCRLQKSNEWATRCVLEASCYAENMFITLTYNNASLPLLEVKKNQYSLNKSHMILFLKRLRWWHAQLQYDKLAKTAAVAQEAGGSEGARSRPPMQPRLSYLQCGEYGEKFGRPHHHACVFGMDMPDKQLLFVKDGTPLYRSNLLDKIWGYGNTTIGEVTYESAAYIARYITKVSSGEQAARYGSRIPEYATMSRNPGLATQWWEQWACDAINADSIIIRGDKKISLPRYFNNKLQAAWPEKLEELKAKRQEKVQSESYKRLADKLICKKSQIINLKRSYENGN